MSVCHLQVSGSLARHKEDFSTQHDKDATVLSHASATLSSVADADQRCLMFQSDIEQCLLCSVRCYENAQASAQSGGLKTQRELGTCLGSAWNEMGLYYMQLSESFSVETGKCLHCHQFLLSCTHVRMNLNVQNYATFTWDNILHVYSLYRVLFMVCPNLNLQILKCACMHMQYSMHVA